ncbi:type II toxin-antitoxin system RelE/ParE family toxin [Duganella radicis]|uniref:Type II toxin-antitoxin system RelE/ParE family toxin n=1 Tax=Duganella radicis TaxID=551988 RepID=A0A6L6PGP0_9BURK|nr:type II toxin-antitoxin system RelE/ParE family toxin [Duganella radicis]MTV38210.1 type II toxin-antitoxin system RelE/ParE family toxin [Duganella radicis]
MARQIIWSDSATEDIEAIADRIAQDSQSNASRVVKKILAVADDLDRFPHLGAVVPEANDANLRQRIVFHYRLIYRIELDTINILAVIHARRRLRNR